MHPRVLEQLQLGDTVQCIDSSIVGDIFEIFSISMSLNGDTIYFIKEPSSALSQACPDPLNSLEATTETMARMTKQFYSSLSDKTLKVVEKVKDFQDGWSGSWDHDMMEYIGNKVQAIEISRGKAGIMCAAQDWNPSPKNKHCLWSFPFFVLAPTNQSSISTTNNKTQYNTICPRCGAPAYIGFNKTECNNGCK